MWCVFEKSKKDRKKRRKRCDMGENENLMCAFACPDIVVHVFWHAFERENSFKE